MSEAEPPKIEFPCPNYPIKVMGEAGEHFQRHVIAVFERHADDFDRREVSVRASRNGRYESLHVAITAQGEEHLVAIFNDLKKHAAVKMVL